MQNDAEQKPRVPGRRLKLLLGLSVALNLAFVGLLAGAFLRHDPMAGRGGPQAYAWPYMAALEREDRRAMFRALRDERKATFPERGSRRAMYDDVVQAMRADPFDAQALQAAVDRQAGIGVAFQQSARAAWLELVAGMSDAERAEYARGVEEALSRRKKRK